jgi:hypothetical protein
MRKQTFYYAALFIFAVITGIAVGCLGQPYNTAVFTLHKVISIGTVVIAVIFIRRQIKQAGVTPVIRNSIIAVSVAAFILVVTGALMSVGVYHDIVRIIHALAPAFTAAAVVWTNMLLKRNAVAIQTHHPNTGALDVDALD